MHNPRQRKRFRTFYNSLRDAAADPIDDADGNAAAAAAVDAAGGHKALAGVEAALGDEAQEALLADPRNAAAEQGHDTVGHKGKTLFISREEERRRNWIWMGGTRWLSSTGWLLLS